MADEWHVKWLKEGVRKWNNRRKKIKFTPNLAGVKLFDVLPEYFRANPKTSMFFEGINLSGANLENADLSNLNFRKANFSFSNISSANMTGTNFTSANFDNARLTESIVDKSDFSFASFVNVNLLNVNFQGANVSQATFVNVELDEVSKNVIQNKGASYFASLVVFRGVKSELKRSAGEPQTVMSRKDKERSDKVRYDVFLEQIEFP